MWRLLIYATYQNKCGVTLVDDRLNGLFIRTVDSVAYHPKSAPSDKGKIPEEWQKIKIIEVD